MYGCPPARGGIAFPTNPAKTTTVRTYGRDCMKTTGILIWLLVPVSHTEKITKNAMIEIPTAKPPRTALSK